ncbi:hypothetical protein F1D05_22600 [Kribbella qitaiheensis]|uniref:AbiV family abortive infection protein n=1 Tax=Kribbella qitaiheensis TaxID=1544730 RepID=A0A7G6X1S3_9ACTN|nr:hypothetical protein [Kribbella qitaiheensis]QNE20188.1 hypothetical protein F1D05_22600 [Kribbella qitaiheensis]
MNNAPKWSFQVREISAAMSLLNHADTVLGDFEFAARSLEPLLTVWSIGAEKLLKLTAGFIHTETHQTWPSKSEMVNDYGHDIARLDDRCRGLFRERLSLATSPGIIEDCLTETETNPLINGLMQTLTRYAKSGRFYNLDHLADSPQIEDSPADLWEVTQQKILAHNPAILAKIGGTQSEYEEARSEMYGESREAARTWRNLYHRAWVQGVCGPTAKQMSYELGRPSAS